MSDLLVREVRMVDLDRDDDPGQGGAHQQEDTQGHEDVVDVLVRGGVIAAVRPHLAASADVAGVPVLDGDGGWLIPGLWDHHVHSQQWALTRARLDLSSARSPRQALDIVRRALASGPLPRTGVLTGWGHRSATWVEDPTVDALDAVAGDVPVVLISADCHHGWVSSSALRLLGAPRTDGVLAEGQWFAAYSRLAALPGAVEQVDEAVSAVVEEAFARGVVGITDLEFGRPWEMWRRRHAAGRAVPRVRAGVYAEHLGEVLVGGARTGDPVADTGGMVTTGPLKIISDGSLNTRTAWCHEPYADADQLKHPRGAPNTTVEEVVELLRAARSGGIEVALHAIGDAAVHQALLAFRDTGARGGIEHAQLVAPADLALWSRLPVRASVQPAHLLDDRVVTEQCWPDRTGHTFTLRSFLDHGIDVVLGSDAPVAPLDPWLAMAAAVHRGPADGESWHPEQALTASAALRASVDGRRVRPGEPGDLALLDGDPLRQVAMTPREQAAVLREMTVSATVLGGAVVHGG